MDRPISVYIFWFISKIEAIDEHVVKKCLQDGILCIRFIDSLVGLQLFKQLQNSNCFVIIDLDNPSAFVIAQEVRSINNETFVLFLCDNRTDPPELPNSKTTMHSAIEEIVCDREQLDAWSRLSNRGGSQQLIQPRVIRFYNKGEPYYEFTNFYADEPILIEGKKWPTSEHYFQAQKFADYPNILEQVRLLETPRDCFDFVRDPKYQPLIRKNWHQIKEDIMLTALRAKFLQNTKLRDLLLQTGESLLVEHTERDDYWGDGGNGTGKNKLGQLLMQVRNELSSSQP